ncbi:ABC transporter ATP-binding protein [Mycetocola zhadangensis]|uniref:ATP-binding cassette domain-containing protein n=1 Tax=Mycetocola zhadangensis TaxID=1164595 RepID=A0A3L7J6Y2_9MICO|nr:ATP-binding cassette domain-containing protein [Mycetocola zhadangensis]RLQ84262.1 ATP-binding cassette domain-containing protein [Mycetocola zhadangensis]GGE94621.1 iron ABC transporter ATP-binding protein [Mycetocola zhadangensis]
MISISQVTKRYGRQAVVDDVSLELGGCGVTSIIGPNGAGKSTLLSMVARLMPLDGGTITIDGLDVKSTPGSVLATKVAVLRQDNHLAARLTVQDLVSFGRYPYSKGRLTTVDRDAIARAIGYLDLEPFADRFLDELSGGQRQRAFIAMVLAQDTDYVLLDEPLNNLDLRHAVEIMKLLRAAADDTGKRIVLVMHDINFASVYSDEIVAMRDGRVVLHGPSDAVMQSEVLGSIYDLPIDVREVDGERIGYYYR